MFAPLLMLATAATASVQPAPATAPDVEVTEKAFDAWLLRCETRRSPAPAVRRCGLLSVVKAETSDGKTTTIASIMLRPVEGTGGYQIAFSLPLNVMLQPGARITNAQESEIVRLPFVACRPEGCEAGSVLTADLLKAFSTGGDRNSVAFDLQNRKSVKLAFSLTGFAAAMRALESPAP